VVEEPVGDDAFFDAVVNDGLVSFEAVEFESHEQAGSAEFPDRGVLQEFAEKLVFRGYATGQVFVQQYFKRCQAGGAAYRVPTEGSDMAQGRFMTEAF